MSLKIFAVLAAIFELVHLRPLISSIGDFVPYCTDPISYKPSLEPNSLNGSFKAQLLTANWFVISNNNAFFLEGCSCAEVQIGKFNALLQDASSELFCLCKNKKLIARKFEIDVAMGLRDVKDSEAAFRFDFGASKPYEYVLDAAADFTWVLLGEPCRKGYLLLSVTPTLSDETLAKIKEKLESLNFPFTEKYSRKSQNCPEILPGINLVVKKKDRKSVV